VRNCYTILGVAPSADLVVIKAAAKALSAMYHPDNSKGTANAAKFREVREALEVLSDPDKRAQHDMMLMTGRPQNGHHQQQTGPAPTGRPVWMNGVGWVIVPAEMPGPFPSDRASAYPEAYPQAVHHLQDMAEKAAEQMLHEMADELFHRMFGKRRYR